MEKNVSSFKKICFIWKRFILFEKDLPRLWTVKWPVLVSLMFPFTLAGTYTEARRLCRTLEVVKHKTMQTVTKTANKYKVQSARSLKIDISRFCIIRALKLMIGDPFAKKIQNQVVFFFIWFVTSKIQGGFFNGTSLKSWKVWKPRLGESALT